MIKIHRVIFSLIAVTFLFLSNVEAQNTKKHTEKFTVDNDVTIHISSSHTNVEFETWDKNEVEITFVMETEENIEESFKKWDFSASGTNNKIEIESNPSFDFDFENFQLDLNLQDLDLNMEELNIQLGELDLGNIDVIVSDMLEDMNLDDLPESPFGGHINFDGNKYEKDPDAYLKKLNDKYNTNITKQEVEQWMDDIDQWSKEIEVNLDGKSEEFEEMERKLSEQTKELEESVEKWEKENKGKLEEMTRKLEEQIEGMNFEQFENFDYFNQDNSKVKKTIRIKMPKKAKLNLDVRYGEVSLADNTINMNADLNYATLSAKTINGADTDISASYAPVYVNHWEDGHLSLNHCNQITIEKATKIALDAQGTDIYIGTLLSSGWFKSAYGNLEINKLEDSLKDLELTVDFGSALINLAKIPIDVRYNGKGKNFIALPNELQVISDTTAGKTRTLTAYNQKQNSGKILAINSNFGELTIK